MRHLLWLDSDDQDTPFPPLEQALLEPNGLIAVGGALSPQRLQLAYRSGIFPWFSEGEPVLWWSPEPRAVFLPGGIKLHRSLRKRMRNAGFQVRLDGAFETVMRRCAEPRPTQPTTWITEAMVQAYVRLHAMGLAHSVEVLREGELVGGLYGVALGRAFFGESMFSRETDASKIALVWLAGQLWRWGFHFIDAQVPNEHLLSLGARLLPRSDFTRRLTRAMAHPDKPGPWSFDRGYTPLAQPGADTI